MDIRTLIVVNLLLSGTLWALATVLARERSLPAVWSWSLVLLTLTLGLAIHALRALIPEIVAATLGNGFLLVAALHADRCARKLSGEDTRDAAGWSIILLTVVGLGALFQATPDLRWRGLLFSLAAAVLLVRAATRFYLAPRESGAGPRIVVATVLAAWGVVHALRAVYFVAAPPWEDFFASGVMNVVAFLPGILFIPLATICVILIEVGIAAPVAATPAAPGANAAPSHAPLPTRASVLLVDAASASSPDPVTLEVLTGLGYRVHVAPGTDAARSLLEGNLNLPDLLLLDPDLPGAHRLIGDARRLQEAHPVLRIFLLRQAGSSGTPSGKAHGGEFPVIRLPLTAAALVSALEDEFARRARAPELSELPA